MTSESQGMSVDLEELACRVEGLTGPDREVDADIWASINGGYIEEALYGPVVWINDKGWVKHKVALGDGIWRERELLGRADTAPAYTASLDAAMTLVKEDAFWRVGHDGEGPDPSLLKAIISVAKEGEVAITFKTALADTAPLALTAAALRARKETTHG